MCFMEFQASEKYRNVLCVWLVGHHTCECVESIPWKSCPVCHQIPSSVGSWRIPYVSHRSSLWIILMFSGKEFPQLCTPLKLFFFPFFSSISQKIWWIHSSLPEFDGDLLRPWSQSSRLSGTPQTIHRNPKRCSAIAPFLRNYGFWSPTSGNLGTDTTKNPTK